MIVIMRFMASLNFHSIRHGITAISIGKSAEPLNSGVPICPFSGGSLIEGLSGEPPLQPFLVNDDAWYAESSTVG